MIEPTTVLDSLAHHLAQAGVATERPDPGSLLARVASAIPVQIQLANGRLNLSADFGVLPEAHSESISAGLLAANLFCESAGGGVFLLDAEQHLKLRREIPLDPGIGIARVCDFASRLIATAAVCASILCDSEPINLPGMQE